MLNLKWFYLIIALVISCQQDDLFVAPELIETGDKVIAPPAGFNSFYKKYLNANGIPVTGSEYVQDTALIRVRHIIINMLAKRPDVLAQMIFHKARMGIIAAEEETSDLPEYADVEDPVSFSKRGRGYGGTINEPFSSCAEENVMRVGKNDVTRADDWHGEDIMVHEFAHSIHLIGLINTIKNFDEKLQQNLNNAKSKGLWKNTYAETNIQEYFAECVQIWFEANLEGPELGDGLHNHINTRKELKDYDPNMYDLLKTIFYDTNWRPLPF